MASTRERHEDGIRIGVVGLGDWGLKHLRALRSLERVRALVGADPRYGVRGSPRFNSSMGLDVYEDVRELLPEVDAVIVATPPSTHASITMQVIEAGRHVLVEKPMAITIADARRLVRAVEGTDRVLMVGHTFEYDAAIRKLREIVTDPGFGRLYYLHSTRLNLGTYREDVNVIFDLAAHDISIANFILGALPTTVTAWGSRHVHPHHEDVAYLRLFYAGTATTVNIHVSWLDPVKVRRIVAAGSAKMAVYDTEQGRGQVQIFEKSVNVSTATGDAAPAVDYREGRVIVARTSFVEPLTVQDRHFVESIINRARPSTGASNGLDVVAVLECAQISLLENRAVMFSEVA